MSNPSPMSRHLISSGETLAAAREYTLTIKLPLISEGAVDPEKLATMLQHRMRDDQHGHRHSFEAEMLIRGLDKMLRDAAYAVIESQAQDEFGHEIITEGNSETSRWYIEAMKQWQVAKKPWFNYEPEVSIAEK